MNRKGNVFFGFALGIFIFVMGVLVLPYLADDVSTFRAALDCSNSSSISGGTMISCLFGSALIPYYIYFFVSLTIGLIIGGFET